MIGAGTIINPLIKVVTTVAILAAVYFLFVKPALDTTTDITNRAFDTSDEIQRDIQKSIRESTPSGANGIEVTIPKSSEKAQKLGACVQGAAGDLSAIEKCMERYAP